ncbi:MAG TPA: lysylphosphatidylglycerol synthase domain-containing protein, partial [Terriglobales bacterium]
MTPTDGQAPRDTYTAGEQTTEVPVGLLAFLLHRFGGSAVCSLLSRERPGYFAAAVALSVAGQVMTAYRWRLLAAVVSIRGPFREFVG